ncbi:hypothetical protein [Rhizobium sp. NFR12]|uniref:hypothetical protein n=1 Tax=Rhizobium sp. NFR12 TaxID=1566261 RepID=UPI0011147DCF|nr:hypothetical protein [Rhizobium sp. NFR12]
MLVKLNPVNGVHPATLRAYGPDKRVSAMCLDNVGRAEKGLSTSGLTSALSISLKLSNRLLDNPCNYKRIKTTGALRRPGILGGRQ